MIIIKSRSFSGFDAWLHYWIDNFHFICRLTLLGIVASTISISFAEEIKWNTFNVGDVPEFAEYRGVIEPLVKAPNKHKINNFCILGVTVGDGGRQAWVWWKEESQLILWEDGESDLTLSRRVINLKKDVVETDRDLRGSTYKVTKSWLSLFKGYCKKEGVGLQLGGKNL